MQENRAALSRFALDPAILYLNHGSFGACPREILEEQRRWQDRMEREPVQFLAFELEGELARVRAALGEFLGADPDDLALVPNATSGVNTVLRSLRFGPGDELLTTDHEYNASRNALDFVAGQSGARVVVAAVPFPAASSEEIAAAILARVTPRTRLALLDHVTSATGLVLPMESLAAELAERGIEVLVDGAHGPGMLPLDLERLGVSFYTGNCHKWLCTPKGSAFLWVRRDRQPAVRPLAISHGANSRREDVSFFRREFDWVGTQDPSAWLCIPSALEFLAGLFPGGWPALRRRNHELVVQGRTVLCAALDIDPPCPAALLGSLASVPLPDGKDGDLKAPFFQDPLQRELYRKHRIEVMITPWPRPPHRLLRISAQAYNRPEDYAALGQALRELLPRG